MPIKERVVTCERERSASEAKADRFFIGEAILIKRIKHGDESGGSDWINETMSVSTNIP